MIAAETPNAVNTDLSFGQPFAAANSILCSTEQTLSIVVADESVACTSRQLARTWPVGPVDDDALRLKPSDQRVDDCRGRGPSA